MDCGTAWWAQPEWWAVAVAALGSFGASCVWLDRRIRENRDALPIVRAKWRQGSEGVGLTIEFQNRLNEDLFIDRAVANATFVKTRPGAYDDEGNFKPGMEDRFESPYSLNVSIPPYGKSEVSFGMYGLGGRWRISVYVSSSNRALRDRRIVIDHKKPR